MDNNVSLFGSAVVLTVGSISINDIYLIIVAFGILVSSIISIIGALKNGKKVDVDSTTYEQLKKIQEELEKEKEEESKNDSLQ